MHWIRITFYPSIPGKKVCQNQDQRVPSRVSAGIQIKSATISIWVGCQDPDCILHLVSPDIGNLQDLDCVLPYKKYCSKHTRSGPSWEFKGSGSHLHCVSLEFQGRGCQYPTQAVSVPTPFWVLYEKRLPGFESCHSRDSPAGKKCANPSWVSQV
jgi:hypothetical protein